MRRSQFDVDAMFPIPDYADACVGCHGEECGRQPPEVGARFRINVRELNGITSLHDVAIGEESNTNGLIKSSSLRRITFILDFI